MSQIHSVVFLTDNKKWSLAKTRKWLKKHDMIPIKDVDKVKVKGKISQYRYRLKDPKKFKRFITKKTKDDINFVIGFPK